MALYLLSKEKSILLALSHLVVWIVLRDYPPEQIWLWVATVEGPIRVAADFFFLWWVFFNTDFVVFSHCYCIRVRLDYNIMLFNSHYICFGSTCQWCYWTKSKFQVETLRDFEIGKDIHVLRVEILWDDRWHHALCYKIFSRL